MNVDKIKTDIESITADSSKSIEHRIEAVLAFRDELDDADKKDELKVDEICYASMIQMLINENATMSNIDDLMQLYTLLAETYDEEENYPPIKEIAYEAIELIRINNRVDSN